MRHAEPDDGRFAERCGHAASIATPSVSRWEFAPGITPFNFPAMVPMWMWPFAIAAGNAFILKPSEKVPLTPTRLRNYCRTPACRMAYSI